MNRYKTPEAACSRTAILIIIAFIAAGAFTTARAQDGFFTDSEILEPETFSASLQPVIYTNPDDFMMMIRGGYGVKENLSVHAKLGALAENTYFGAHAEYDLISEAENAVTVSSLGGLYVYHDFGIKLGAKVSKQIEFFSLYSGLNTQVHFSDDVMIPMLIPFGVDIPLPEHQTHFIFETNVGMNSDASAFEMLSFGVNYYFDY
mgnify:CR=1 FL=1